MAKKRIHPITEMNNEFSKAIFLAPFGCLFIGLFWGLVFTVLGWLGLITVHH